MNTIARQWNDYRRVHHRRQNLIIHLLTVPVFMAGTVAAVAGVALVVAGKMSILGGAAAMFGGLFAMVFAIGMQGIGHKMEPETPEPFQGPKDVVLRLFAEQWITFPRYVLSGGLARAMTSEVMAPRAPRS